MRWIASSILVLALGGCAPGEKIAHQASPDEVRPFFCTFELTTPEALGGQLMLNDAAGVDCVAPEAGDTFKVGFGRPTWRLVVTVPRTLNEPSETPIPLDGGTVALLYQGRDAWCSAWRGELSWLADAPRWSISVDATCANDAELHVAGQWTGQSAP